jgi:hypothetical protein
MRVFWMSTGSRWRRRMQRPRRADRFERVAVGVQRVYRSTFAVSAPREAACESTDFLNPGFKHITQRSRILCEAIPGF